MGILGLAEPIDKQENLVQRLFWPSDHAGEADFLAQQGFWICALVAVASSLILLLQAHWGMAFLTLAFFILGGIGVREHNTPAAACVALAYLFNQATGLMSGRYPGFMSIVAAVLLIANIRGTWVAARWARNGDPHVFPERLRRTWKDRLVDQMPTRVWPLAKLPFFCIAGAYMLLTISATVTLAHHIARPAVAPGATHVAELRPR